MWPDDDGGVNDFSYNAVRRRYEEYAQTQQSNELENLAKQTLGYVLKAFM